MGLILTVFPTEEGREQPAETYIWPLFPLDDPRPHLLNDCPAHPFCSGQRQVIFF